MNPKIYNRKSIRLKGYDYSKAGAYFITICCDKFNWRFGYVTVDRKTQKSFVQLNEFGKIAFEEWINLKTQFPSIELDVFQIMPNHMHGIIILKKCDEFLTSAPHCGQMNMHAGAGLVPALVTAASQSITPPRIFSHPKIDPAGFEKWMLVNTRAGASAANVHSSIDLVHSKVGAGASPAPTVGDIVGAYKSLVANRCLTIYKSRNQRMGKLWQRNYWDVIIRNEEAYQKISNYILNNPAKWMKDKFFKLQQRG
jgi:putative transposase